MKSKLSFFIITALLIQVFQYGAASIQTPVLNDDFDSYSLNENMIGSADGEWLLNGDVTHFLSAERDAENMAAQFSTVGKTGDGYVYKNFASGSTALRGEAEVSFDYKIDASYSRGMQFNIQPPVGHGICIEFGIDSISYNNGSGVLPVFSALGKNIWRSVTITANTGDDTFAISVTDINGTQSASGLACRGTLASGIGRVLIASKKGDAVVWMDNLKAGLAESGGSVTPPDPIENNEVIIFIGDSITAAGGYPNYLQDFYATRYPDKRMTYYNSACGGHTAGDVLLRYDYDVKPYADATQIYILLGTNDIKPFLYVPENEGNPSKDAEKAAYMASAQSNMNLLLSKIRTDFPAVSLTLMLDPAIDVESDWVGAGVTDAGVFSSDVNDALRALGESYQQLCTAYNASYVDMNLAVYQAVRKQIDLGISPDNWIVKKDRIHPNNIGQMVMTYALLKTLEADDPVSLVTIDAANLSAAGAVNCTVSNLAEAAGAISFSYAPKALPMYATNDYAHADRLVAWSDELNREIVRVENLPAGSYEVVLGASVPITATSAALAAGINISTFLQNPNQKISLGIYNVSKVKRAKEVVLRDIMRAMTQLIKDGIDLNDAGAVVAQLISYGTESSLGKNAQTALDNISDFSDPMVSIRRMQDEIKDIEAELYGLCVPVAYTMVIRRSKESRELGLLHQEDFEDMTDGAVTWSANTRTTNKDRADLTDPSDGRISIVTDAAGRYNKVLKIEDASTSKIVRADGTALVNGRTNLRIELDMKPQPYSVLQFTSDSEGAYSNDSNCYFFHLGFLEGGRLQYRDTGPQVDTEAGNLYNAGEWNHITVYLDTARPAYSIYVNGALLVERSVLKWGAGKILDTIITGSMFSASRTMETCVDNIKIYDEDCKVVVNERGFYSDGSFTDVPAGGTAVRAAANFVNQTGMAYPVSLVLAQYNKQGILTAIAYGSSRLAAAAGIQSMETSEITAQADSTFKIMVWNDALNPLCDLLEVSNFETWEEISKHIKLLYSSDTTNILTCVSPWRAGGVTTLSEALITAPLDEVSHKGIDVYNIQPGLCWVPWWQSEVYPAARHVEWFHNNIRQNASNPFLSYTLAGNDLISQSADKAKGYGKGFMVSFRLNDVHQKDVAFDASKARIESVPDLYWNHPEYLVGTDPAQASYGRYVQDWRFAGVREYKFSLIKELIENYDIDGIELDFMRSTVLFNTQLTTHDERDGIMLDFVKRVRRELDKKDGRYRYLSVRIPAHIYSHDAIGVDVEAFAQAGVNIFDLSTYFCMEQETSLGQIKRLAGEDCLVFAELTSVISFESIDGQTTQRRATPEQLNTAAYLAYQRGADGISLYNFQYYREQANIDDGPYSEPPFALIEGFKNKEYLSALPQHYFYAVNHQDPKKPQWPLPKQLTAAQTASWDMDMAQPAGGWSGDGVLRIQGRQPFTNNVFSARINGVLLEASPDVSEPYANPYTQMLGSADELRAWAVPRSVLREGRNAVAITMESGDTAVLDYIDLAIQ